MRDDKGQSQLDIALENLGGLHGDGCVDVALYLMSHGCGDEEDKAKLLCRACYRGKLGVVKELVEQHKVDPKSECDDATLEHNISEYNNNTTIQYPTARFQLANHSPVNTCMHVCI